MRRGLILVGMPGSGKTYWAQRLGEYLRWPCLDLDAYVEEQAGQSISDIFGKEGERGFRIRESQALADILDRYRSAPFVLATGGGILLNPDHINWLRQTGWLVYLKARIPTLLSRLLEDGIHTRPLLNQGENLEPYLCSILDQRSLGYEEADFILDADQLSLGKFDRILSLCIGKQ